MLSLVIQLCTALHDPLDCSPPGSAVRGISKQEYWRGLSFSSAGDLSGPGIKSGSPTLQADSLHVSITREAHDIQSRLGVFSTYGIFNLR